MVQQLVSYPGYVKTTEKVLPGTPVDKKLGGLRTDWDALNRKMSCPYWKSNQIPQSPRLQPSNNTELLWLSSAITLYKCMGCKSQTCVIVTLNHCGLSVLTSYPMHLSKIPKVVLKVTHWV
jgi:hypothetical protein